MISQQLQNVRKNIADACARSGRDPSEVTLLAVSKTKPVSAIQEAMAAGQLAFGENYVQELEEKAEYFDDLASRSGGTDAVMPVWHMIGHLQRNKVKNVIDRAVLIHSVDSITLAEKIEREAEKRGVTAKILLEVNIAGEKSKWGFSPEEALNAAKEMKSMSHTAVCGLMTSAPYTTDPESNRMHFRALKRLLDTMDEEGLFSECPPVLSMGMTGDYQVAVEEGATIVRIGTAIFGER